MQKVRYVLLTNWTFMRVLRLMMGLVIAYQAFSSQIGLMGLLAAFFIFQALSNTGCCGSSGCAVLPPNKTRNSVEP